VPRGVQRRRPCDICPSVKRVVSVVHNGKRLDLCEPCRLELSKLIRAKQAITAAETELKDQLEPAMRDMMDQVDADMEAAGLSAL
jgi:hypothetical protein